MGALSNYGVTPANTSVTVVSANPATGDVFGQTVVLSATVTNTSTPAAVNGGTVSFYDGPVNAADLLGTSGPVNAGSASIITGAIPAGANQTITAVYGNAANFSGNTGTLNNYSVAQANTATAVSAAPASGDVYGQTVTLTAAVTNTNTAAAVNGGTVNFYNGAAVAANLLGTSTAVVNGAASITTTALPVAGNLTITAVYSGNSNFAGSTGTQTNYAVAQANTTTAVTASPASGDVIGAAVTFTATVAPVAPSGLAVNGGTVEFFDGSPVSGILLGISGAVAGGTATLTTSALTLGNNHTITAEYLGSASYLASAGTLLNYAVGKDNTTTTIAAAPASGDVFGESVTFTAIVTINAPGVGTPNSGTVSFYSGTPGAGTFIGTSPVSGGVASVSTAALAVSGYTINAVYTGDGVDINGSSGTLAYTVAQANTTTAVSANPSSGDLFGQTVTLTATIGVTAPGAGTINGGTVSFYDGPAIPANLLGTSGAVANGTVSISTARAVGRQQSHDHRGLHRYQLLRRQHRHTQSARRGPGRHQHRGQRGPRQRRPVRPDGHPDGDSRECQLGGCRQRRHRELLRRRRHPGQPARHVAWCERRLGLDHHDDFGRRDQSHDHRRLLRQQQLCRQHRHVQPLHRRPRQHAHHGQRLADQHRPVRSDRHLDRGHHER